MRLATLSTPSGPRPAAVVGNAYIDLRLVDPKLPPTVRQIIADPAALKAAEAASHVTASHSVDSATFLSPIPDPQKIVCVGLNYRDHALESKLAIPKEPVLFSKFPSALIGHGRPIVHPNQHQGRFRGRTRHCDRQARPAPRRGRRPAARRRLLLRPRRVGPRLAVGEGRQAVDGRQDVRLVRPGRPRPGDGRRGRRPARPRHPPPRQRPDDAGEQHQSVHLHRPAEIAYISQIVTLEPGDLIFTGTPPGIGHARTPPIYLKPGDVAEVEIDGLGVLLNPVVAE